MKKHLVLWSALTLAAALAFVNNLAVIARWWQAFLRAGGDSSQMPAHVPGLFAWLDWSAVDYSAVSTFIPLLGCLCVVRGIVRILRGRVQSAEHFPFFASADQLNVALGLFGTLWGIIVIGYFRLDKVSMGDLMHCLHTALFSTLVAVVWVFMVDHPLIRPWMRRRLLAANLVKTDGAPLADAVDAFVARLAAASEAFDRRQREGQAAFENRQRLYEDAFNERLLRAEEAFNERHRRAEEAFAAQLESLRRANDEMAAAAARARAAEAQAEEGRRAAEARAEAGEARARDAERKLEGARAALRG